MTASERERWETTTHLWAFDVDMEHLQTIRREARTFSAGGRRHLILEVLSYADDEAESQRRIGHAQVRIGADGWVSVSDDGRGTDTRRDENGHMIRKPIMASRDVRFFDASPPALLPDGLPRRGMSTVAALSPALIHENHRAEGSWSQRYHFGVPEQDLREAPGQAHSGTTVAFLSDVQGPAFLTDEDLTAFAWLTVDCAVEITESSSPRDLSGGETTLESNP